MIIATLPFSIVSNVFIIQNVLFIANGPQLLEYDLLNRTSKVYSYLRLCGSFECVPFCVGQLNGSIVVGTSGSLLKLNGSSFEVLLKEPVTWCSNVISVSEVYRDAWNVVTYGKVLDEQLRPSYEGCAVYTAVSGYYSLICNQTFYLKTPRGTTKVDSPGLIAKAGRYVGVLLLTGEFLVFENGELKYQLKVPSTPPYFLNSSEDSFLITAGGKVYMWRNGKLYVSNLTEVLQAVWYRNAVVSVRASEGKLVVELIESVEWKEVRKGGAITP